MTASSNTATNISAMTEEQKREFGKAIGRIASGVYVLTANASDAPEGLLASWVQQCGFEPPMLMIAVKQERKMLDLLGTGNRFTLNVLSKKNLEIFKHFAKPHSPGVDRFEGISTETSDFGPILSDTISYLNCQVTAHNSAGDHVVVVAEIKDGKMLNADDEPMVHLRSSGFHY